MIKLLLITCATLTLTLGFAQTNFNLVKIDSLNKTKNQIYSDTKMFIAEEWKSAQNVIQNDDKEAGMVLVRGSSKQTVGMGMGALVEIWYIYDVKFLMKEGKYKLILENVKYEKGPSTMWDKYAEFLEPHDKDTFPGAMKCGLYEKRWNELMASLKSDMQKIMDDYGKYIRNPSSTNTGW